VFKRVVFVVVVVVGWYRDGQRRGLLPFPRSQKGSEEDHGGGAGGRRQLQTVCFFVFSRNVISWYILIGPANV